MWLVWSMCARQGRGMRCDAMRCRQETGWMTRMPRQNGVVIICARVFVSRWHVNQSKLFAWSLTAYPALIISNLSDYGVFTCARIVPLPETCTDPVTGAPCLFLAATNVDRYRRTLMHCTYGTRTSPDTDTSLRRLPDWSLVFFSLRFEQKSSRKQQRRYIHVRAWRKERVAFYNLKQLSGDDAATRETRTRAPDVGLTKDYHETYITLAFVNYNSWCTLLPPASPHP